MVSFLEVAAHPLFKVLCLAHIQHSPFFVFEEVTARQVRKSFQVNHF
jgi:hypothetical protein